MAKKIATTSKAAATPLRRSARFKAQNPINSISGSHVETYSSHVSILKSSPCSANSKGNNSENKTRLRGKQTCAPNVCENVSGKETVKSSATTTLRRSPRFKPQKSSKPIIGCHREPLSPVQSNLKLTPSSANLKGNNRAKKTRVGGKESFTPSVCEIVSEKYTVLGSVGDRRKSPRLAQISKKRTVQDAFCDPKRRDCTVTKLSVEETCPQSACEISSDKVSISSSVNAPRMSRRAAKIDTVSIARRTSPRLAAADTSGGFNVETKKKSKRSGKSKQHMCPNKRESSGSTICPPDAQNNATTKSNCIREPESSCSKGRRRRSHRLVMLSKKLEANFLEEEISCVSQQCLSSPCENALDKAAILVSKPPMPPNKRKPKQIDNRSDEISRKSNKSKYVEESDSDYESEESPVGKKRKREESAETEAPLKFENGELADGLDGWTEEQEIALHKAYFLARPSPHFWKKVSKMVPGKNAQDCFNRIQSNFATPPSIPPRTRLNRGSRIDSPLKKFNLLEANSPMNQVCAEPKICKVPKQKKTWNARKALRHLVNKQQLANQVQEADYFSQFEASPVILPSDVKLPSDFSCKERVNLCLENNLKPGPSQNQPDPSPAVLKQVKNMELHEKYINHLHCVDARRKACARPSYKGKEVDLGKQTGDVKDAKTALVSEAQDFIGCYKRLQADPFGDCALSDEDDEDDVV